MDEFARIYCTKKREVAHTPVAKHSLNSWDFLVFGIVSSKFSGYYLYISGVRWLAWLSVIAKLGTTRNALDSVENFVLKALTLGVRDQASRKRSSNNNNNKNSCCYYYYYYQLPIINSQQPARTSNFFVECWLTPQEMLLQKLETLPFPLHEAWVIFAGILLQPK